MAIEAVSATVPLKAGERLAGLNHVAELRAMKVIFTKLTRLFRI